MKTFVKENFFKLFIESSILILQLLIIYRVSSTQASEVSSSPPASSSTPIIVSSIKIGQQEWMTEDINTTVYNNGDLIYEANNEKQWLDYGTKKQGCYRKLMNGTYVYNGYVIKDKRGIIPSGFILPSYDQFNQLIKYLGAGDSQSGEATKSMVSYPIYIEEWVGDLESGGLEGVEIKTNENSGFKANEGGFVYDFGQASEGNCSYWWTSSSEGANTIVVDIGYCSQDPANWKKNGSSSLDCGYAIRAIKQ